MGTRYATCTKETQCELSHPSARPSGLGCRLKGHDHDQRTEAHPAVDESRRYDPPRWVDHRHSRDLGSARTHFRLTSLLRDSRAMTQRGRRLLCHVLDVIGAVSRPTPCNGQL